MKSKSSNLATYGELGRFPLFIDIISQSINYFYNNVLHGENKQLQLFIKELLNNPSLVKNNLILQNKLLLEKSGLYLSKDINYRIKRYLQMKFKEFWKDNITTRFSKTSNSSGNKLRSYRLFKSVFKFESYLDQIKSFKHRKILCQFRISDHNLKIERGRYFNIPINERKCINCNLNEIEDEFHFIIKCPTYNNERHILFNVIEKHNKYFNTYSDENKLYWILSNESPECINALIKFLEICMSRRKD